MDDLPLRPEGSSPDDACPDDGAVALLLAGTADAAQRRSLGAHLARCGRCRSRAAARVVRGAETPPISSSNPAANVVWAAAFVTAFLCWTYWRRVNLSEDMSAAALAGTPAGLEFAASCAAAESPEFADFRLFTRDELLAGDPPGEPKAEGAPHVMLPSGVNLEDRPACIWLSVPGGGPYAVTVFEGDAVVWTRTVDRGRAVDVQPITFDWPLDVKPLRFGGEYRIEIECVGPDGRRTASSRFNIASEAEVKAFRNLWLGLERRFGAPTGAVVAAHLAMRRGYRAEAWQAASKAQLFGPTRPLTAETMYRALLLIGRPDAEKYKPE